MKKTLLTALAVVTCLMTQAQLVEVASVDQVTLPQGVAVGEAVLSPDGTGAVVTTLSGRGLSHLDLSTGALTQFSQKATAYDLSFTADGRSVVYRESSFDNNHRRLVAVKSYDISAQKIRTLVQPTRNLQGMTVEGQTAAAVVDGRMHTQAVKGTVSPIGRPVVSIDRGRLYVTANGETREIRPLGDACNSYLWPTVSPDGQRIAGFAVGNGAFSCKLDGSDVKPLGMLRATVWLDNDIIVGMDDHDNGTVTTASALVAVKADGTVSQRLTGDEYVAVFPSTADNRIAFTTPEGKMYIINLKK